MHRLHTVILLFFSICQVHPVLGGVGRIVPPEVIDIRDNALHHNAYVDTRIRINPHNMLNHQQYHQRNVDPNVEVQAFDGPPASAAADPSMASSSYAASSSTSLLATDSTIISPLATFSPLAVASPSEVPVNNFVHLSKSVASIDPNAAWNNQTDMACMLTLIALNGSASNSAGLAACYNVRTFDNTTGAFQVDLRLYRICAAVGDWATLKTQAVSVGLSYAGASVAAGSMSKVKRNGKVLSWSPVKRDTTVAPHMLEVLNFVGKVHDDQMAGIKNDTTARSLLVPNIALSGTAQNNTPITSQLSSDDASFVNGVFADRTRAATALTASTSTGPPRATAFVLPGTVLGVFPTGLIITSAWAFLFIATVGYGTLGRIRFRDSYRRRIKARLNAGVRTI